MFKAALFLFFKSIKEFFHSKMDKQIMMSINQRQPKINELVLCIIKWLKLTILIVNNNKKVSCSGKYKQQDSIYIIFKTEKTKYFVQGFRNKKKTKEKKDSIIISVKLIITPKGGNGGRRHVGILQG